MGKWLHRWLIGFKMQAPQITISVRSEHRQMWEGIDGVMYGGKNNLCSDQFRQGGSQRCSDYNSTVTFNRQLEILSGVFGQLADLRSDELQIKG